MRLVFLIGFIIFIQVKKVLCDQGFGSVFPIPLTVSNDDPNFRQCPPESGAYPHTTNCSIFHMCTFGVDIIYSCIDGFYFNPSTGKCQHWPVEKELKCTDILQQMTNSDLFSLGEPVKNYDYYHRRKSATTKCTQTGIYPDVLDCSLFHYCHKNQEHEILKCPDGLNFDPKLFMCSARQLINCQYEPPMETQITEDETDNNICHDYTPGTHLPIANKFDEFRICGKDGKNTVMKCKPGSSYNALTTQCELRPCARDETLCKNNGHCIDDPTNEKGFQCICPIEYQGKYCENSVKFVVNVIKPKIDTSTKGLFKFVNHLKDVSNKPLTTTTKTKVSLDFPSLEDKTDVLPVNSPLSRVFHRLNNNYGQQESIDEMIRVIFMIILTLMLLIFLGSIIFGIAFCIRLLSSPPKETVGTWNILPEETKV